MHIHILSGYSIGLGNIIEFIPTIRHLQEQGNKVTSNSMFLAELDITDWEHKEPDLVIAPHWPADWKWQFRFRKMFPRTRILMPQMRIKGRHYPTLVTRSYPVDLEEKEPIQYQKVFGHYQPYHIDGWDPIEGMVIIGTSGKKDKMLPVNELLGLVNQMKNAGYTPIILGEQGAVFKSYLQLFDTVRGGAFYFGVDCGTMHLCDILGMPGLCLWGSGWKKSYPMNNIKVIGKEAHESHISYFEWFQTAYESTL